MQNEPRLEDMLKTAGANDAEIAFFKQNTPLHRQLVDMIRKMMRTMKGLAFTRPALKDGVGQGKRRGIPSRDQLIKAMIRVAESKKRVTQVAVGLELGYGCSGKAISGLFRTHPELKAAYDSTLRQLRD